MIYFIRHGESEANLEHIFAGQRDDSLLTKKGREQAKMEAEKIKDLGIQIDQIVSSPLIRALDTAKIVASGIGYIKDILIDSRIAEYDMGVLSGTPMHEITSKMIVSAEEAEDPKVFCERVKSFLEEYKSFDGNVLMVCHAGIGRIIETIRQNREVDLFYDLPPYPNASVIKLDWLK